MTEHDYTVRVRGQLCSWRAQVGHTPLSSFKQQQQPRFCLWKLFSKDKDLPDFAVSVPHALNVLLSTELTGCTQKKLAEYYVFSFYLVAFSFLTWGPRGPLGPKGPSKPWGKIRRNYQINRKLQLSALKCYKPRCTCNDSYLCSSIF